MLNLKAAIMQFASSIVCKCPHIVRMCSMALGCLYKAFTTAMNDTGWVRSPHHEWLVLPSTVPMAGHTL